jgi:hypothetical protein
VTADHADFIAKLRQIEEQANTVGAELPLGLAKTRVQQIVVLAKTLRGRLEFGGASVVMRSAPAAIDVPAPGQSSTGSA